MLERFNAEYWRYVTTLDDPRLTKFIAAMQSERGVSFSGTAFMIKHIHMTPIKAIVVLKEM